MESSNSGESWIVSKNVSALKRIVNLLRVGSEVLFFGLRSLDVTDNFKFTFVVSQLVLGLLRVVDQRLLELLGMRNVVEDLVMVEVPENCGLWLGASDVTHVERVSRFDLLLLAGLSTLDVGVVDVVADELGHWVRHELHALQFVTWVQRVAVLPSRLELHAVWLRPRDVLVTKVVRDRSPRHVQVARHAARNVMR